MTPLKCKWFTGKGLIGIVMSEATDGSIIYSIGTGDGLNEVIDINNISAHGSRLPQSVGDAIFGTTGVRTVEKRPSRAKRVPAVAKAGRSKTGKVA